MGFGAVGKIIVPLINSRRNGNGKEKYIPRTECKIIHANLLQTLNEIKIGMEQVHKIDNRLAGIEAILKISKFDSKEN
jgi:hypothetical protein